LLLTEQASLSNHHHKKHHKKHHHKKLRGKKVSKEDLEELRTTYTLLKFTNEFCDGPYHAIELKINQTKAIHLKGQKKTLCSRLTKDVNSTMALSSCPGSGEQCAETCDTCNHGNFMRFPQEQCSKGGWILLQGPAPTECSNPRKHPDGKKNNCKGVNNNDLGLVKGCAFPTVPVSQLSTNRKHRKGTKGTSKNKHHKKHHKRHHKKHHADGDN
jgi:hypothetical protein